MFPILPIGKTEWREAVGLVFLQHVAATPNTACLLEAAV